MGELTCQDRVKGPWIAKAGASAFGGPPIQTTFPVAPGKAPPNLGRLEAETLVAEVVVVPVVAVVPPVEANAGVEAGVPPDLGLAGVLMFVVGSLYVGEIDEQWGRGSTGEARRQFRQKRGAQGESTLSKRPSDEGYKAQRAKIKGQQSKRGVSKRPSALSKRPREEKKRPKGVNRL